MTTQEKKEAKRLYDKVRYNTNRDKILHQKRLWRIKNPDSHRLWQDRNESKKYSISKREYRIKNAEKIRLRKRKYIKENENVRIARTLCKRVVSAIKKNSGKASNKSSELLGCTIDVARKHLESKFMPGMSWDNHTTYGWHIDHIVPCSSFNLNDIEQQKICFHYTNMQPLWWNDNLKKASKIGFKEYSMVQKMLNS